MWLKRTKSQKSEKGRVTLPEAKAEDPLKEVCGSDGELFHSLNTLGLFLKHQDQKEIERFLDKVKVLETQGRPTQEARYVYRILIRLGLQLGRSDLVREYAEKESSFASEKSLLKPFIERTSDAMIAAKKYYEKMFENKEAPA